MVAKLSGTQIAAILLSLIAVFVFLVGVAVPWARSFHESFWLDGNYYEMVGISKFQDRGQILYVPVFKEKK